MTAVIRRWTRRCKPNDLSNGLAAVRGYRSKNLGSVEVNLLVQDQFRKVVALALFLDRSRQEAPAFKPVHLRPRSSSIRFSNRSLGRASVRREEERFMLDGLFFSQQA